MVLDHLSDTLSILLVELADIFSDVLLLLIRQNFIWFRLWQSDDGACLGFLSGLWRVSLGSLCLLESIVTFIVAFRG